MDSSARDPSTASHDASLMTAICARQPEALQALYDHYFRRAYALALRMLADPAAAEDCVHDVFLRIWQNPYTFDAGRGAFVHWFLAAVHNHASKHLRRRGRTQPLAGADDSFAPGDPGRPEPGDRQAGQSSVEDTLGQAETQQAVRAALAGLSAPQRVALELAYFGGMTQSEIATHLQEPLGTIKTRMRTGMIKLRSVLETEHSGKDLEWR